MTNNAVDEGLERRGISAEPGRLSQPQAERGFRLGAIAGVEIRLDWSLIFVFVLISVNLGAGLFPAQHPDWSPVLTWSTAVAAAVLFLASVLAHELAHALVGRRQGVPIEGITLFLFGGMARMRSEPQSPKAELAMTVVGPLTSLAIGAAAILAGAALSDRSPAAAADPAAFIRDLGPAATLLFWLGPVNVLLALFNLLPGFPLDGGRLLRAVLWRATGDFEKATRWSAGVGRALALGLMFLGALMIFGSRVPLLGGGLAQGLWLVFLGWFLSTAAVASYQHVVVRQLFRDVAVSRLMRAAPRSLDRQATLQQAADVFLEAPSERCLPVMDGSTFVGLLCLSDLRKAPRTAWSERTVGEVMTPREALVATTPDEPVPEALQKLARGDVDQLPVLEQSALRGFLKRADVIRWLELRGAQAA